jgi:hypothetical protein
MSPRTACGGLRGQDTDDWKLVTCAECLVKQVPLALNRAHYYGKEFEANPGSNMREYLDDCAHNLGADTWADLPSDKKSSLRKAFDEGRAIERAHNVRTERW